MGAVLSPGKGIKAFTDSFMVQSEVTIRGCIPEEDVFLFSGETKPLL